MENLRSQERLNRLDKEHVVYLGRLAIRADSLGINDPITHLYQYLERGEVAEIGIKEDLETDIAERLPKTPFINHVGFEFTGSDFVSAKDKVSMAAMTKNNLKILRQETIKNPALQAEYVRAKVEACEVDKLAAWFTDAPVDTSIIFESLPIGDQKFAISRIYKKLSNDKLDGCFVSLYNSSVEGFNEFHKLLDIEIPDGKDELEILQNNYEVQDGYPTKFNNFVDHYVDTYDQLLEVRKGQQFSFGIETDKNVAKQNGIKLVRNQPRLMRVYLDTIKTLAISNGLATDELIKINDDLETGYKLIRNQKMSVDIVHKMLKDVILGITKAIDTGSSQLLVDLEKSYAGTDTNFAAVSHFAQEAKANNETYDSNGCPEIGINQVATELESVKNGFRLTPDEDINQFNKYPKNFGRAKIGVCRISNCPSRGDIWWWPDKTLVGGCSICTCCHNLFEKGKSPELVYANNGSTVEKKMGKVVQRKLESKQPKKLKTAA